MADERANALGAETSEPTNVVRIDGRNRRPWSVETREALLQAAIAEIAERGYEHARLVDIAARVDMTVGAVYNWFENRAELFRAAIDYAFRQQQERNQQVFARPKTQAATGFNTDHWIVLIAALLPRNSDDKGPTEAQRMLLEALRSAWRDDDARESSQRQVAALLAQYESLIQKAMRDGLIDPTLDARLVARVFLAFPVGLSSLTLAGAPDIEPRKFIELFTRLNDALAPR